MSKPLNRWALFSGLTNNKMKMKIKKLLMALAFSMLSAIASAQEARVGINTTTPKTTLDVSGKLNTAGTAVDPADVTGLQAPRITLTELNAKGVSLYGASQKGALIYITSATAAEITAAASNTQAPNITATGYYYFDGSVWQKVTNGASATPEPWYNVATNTAATSNTENIYQMGKVLVGTTTVPTGGTNSKLIIDNGTTNGAVQIKDGTEGAGKVLTSDANGVGTWKKVSNFTLVNYNASMDLTVTPLTSTSVATQQSVGNSITITVPSGYANNMVIVRFNVWGDCKPGSVVGQGSIRAGIFQTGTSASSNNSLSMTTWSNGGGNITTRYNLSPVWVITNLAPGTYTYNVRLNRDDETVGFAPGYIYTVSGEVSVYAN